MLKNIFGYFFYINSEYSFSQNNIFIHACSTPLTILLSNLEEDIVNNVNETRSRTSLIAATKLSKLIKLVDSKKIVNEKFNVLGAINEVLCLMSEKIDKKSFGSKLLIKDDLILTGNKLYFQEAITCILNNSIEAYEDVDQKPLNFIVRKVNNFLRIDEVDYASGMNMILQKIVLLKGITTKKNGMGLGLNFAKKTIEEIFSGKMTIRSSVGLGTHITMIIPL